MTTNYCKTRRSSVALCIMKAVQWPGQMKWLKSKYCNCDKFPLFFFFFTDNHFTSWIFFFFCPTAAHFTKIFPSKQHTQECIQCHMSTRTCTYTPCVALPPAWHLHCNTKVFTGNTIPVALVFACSGPAGIEATSLSSSPVCVCSCRTCPVQACTASISCLSESAGGPWAGRAAECSLYGQERVKVPHSWVLEAATNIAVYWWRGWR